MIYTHETKLLRKERIKGEKKGEKKGENKKKRREANFSPILYPDPGSNRDGLLHWCLRPARLPIPPSGRWRFCGCKGTIIFLSCKIFRTKLRINVHLAHTKY